MSKYSVSDIFGIIAVTTITMVILVGTATLIHGIVIMNLWNWLLVPVFESLPILNFGHALGISFVISFMTKAQVSTKSDNATAYYIGNSVINPLLVLFIGWLIQAYLY